MILNIAHFLIYTFNSITLPYEQINLRSLNNLSIYMRQSHSHQDSTFCHQFFQLQYKNRAMQTQDHKLQKTHLSNSQQDLIALLTATFRGRSQSQTRRAQLFLQQSFNDPTFPNKIASIITKPSIDKQIRKAGANILKSLAYQIANKECDKSAFVQIVYSLIMIEGLETKIKEQLGGALEHVFNRDTKGVYKSIVKAKVLQILVSQEGGNSFDSCISILNAYFNSLLAEPEEMFEFFHQILQPICSQALQIYQHVSKMSFNEWMAKDKLILPQITSFFQFLEASLQKMADQQDYFVQQTASIRQNPFLVNLLENYLLLFHDHQSIISNSYPIINPVKNTIMNCIWYLYDSVCCPEKMFKIIFLTTLVECKQIINQIQHQNILVNCLNILQSHMSRRQYASLYQYHQMEFVFALFMYSSTNEEQRDLMSTQPTKFAQIAQDYTEGAPRSAYLKIRAGSMLKVFAEKLDEALRNILEILMVIMSGSLSPQEQDSVLMQNVKEQFSKFNFYGLNDEQKLQTSFMVLATLSPLINKREDLNKVIYSFFLTQFQSLNRINSELVILRLIRTISYFPSALYFLYIETQMNRGGVFIIQGIKALERILRTNRFDELFRFLSTIFIKLMGVLRIQDPVMQLIIINYYQKMLKANSQLYSACRSKIKQSFFLNVMNNNNHGTLICFNLMYFLLKKEQDLSQLDAIQKDFYDISYFVQKQQQLSIYNKYQEKLIEIYQLIMQKKPSITAQVQAFAINSLKHISSHDRGSQIFKFYNIYLIKLDGAIFKLDGYFKIFWNEVKRRFSNYDQDRNVFNALPYFFFLMSEIIANHGQIILSEQDFRNLIQMTEKLPNSQKQYPLIVFLTHLYMQPKLTVNFLKKYNIYEAFVDGLTGIDFDGMIIKKIFNLSLIMLLQIEQDANLTKKILIKCISHLKEVIQKIRIKLQRQNHIQIKPRKFGQQRSMVSSKNEQSMQHEDKNDNELINLFVNFKHPLETLSQFDQFKIKIWMNDSIISDLDENTKIALRNIMETEMVDKAKMRVIKKVRRMI